MENALVGVVFWHAASRRSWKLRSSQSRKSIRTHTISMRGQLALNTVTHRRTTWEQFWIVCALRHGYESFGLCCVHRRSMERCWLPRRTAGRSRRIRSRSSETTSRSQSAEPLCPPRVPSYSHAYPQQPSPSIDSRPGGGTSAVWRGYNVRRHRKASACVLVHTARHHKPKP